jgi:chemotaxis protein MotB
MNRTPIVILGALLVIAAAAGIYLYIQNTEKEGILSERSREMNDLNVRIADLDNRLNKSDTQNQENAKIITALQNEAKRIIDYEKEIQDKDQALMLLKDTVSNLEATEGRLITECEQTTASFKSRLVDCSQQIGEAKVQYQSLRDSYDQLTAEMASASQKLAQKQAQSDTLHVQINGLADDLKKAKTELGDLQNRLTALAEERHLDQKREKRIKDTYEKLLAELRDEVEKKETVIQRVREKLMVTFINKVLFDTGKSSITSTGEHKLKKVATILSDVKEGSIKVSGHTDNVPIAFHNRSKYPSNWELSTARAAAVVRFLIDQGNLIPENIEAVGHSFFKPVAGNDTPDGRAQNRRVEIAIVP